MPSPAQLSDLQETPLTVLLAEVGIDQHAHKLRAVDIPVIRDRLAQGETSYRIAKDYPVSPATILRIGAGDYWKHVQ